MLKPPARFWKRRARRLSQVAQFGKLLYRRLAVGQALGPHLACRMAVPSTKNPASSILPPGTGSPGGYR